MVPPHTLQLIKMLFHCFLCLRYSQSSVNPFFNSDMGGGQREWGRPSAPHCNPAWSEGSICSLLLPPTSWATCKVLRSMNVQESTTHSYPLHYSSDPSLLPGLEELSLPHQPQAIFSSWSISHHPFYLSINSSLIFDVLVLPKQRMFLLPEMYFSHSLHSIVTSSRKFSLIPVPPSPCH